MSVIRAVLAGLILALLGFVAPAGAADVVAPEQGLIFSGLLGFEAGVRSADIDMSADSDGENGDSGYSDHLQINGEGLFSIPLTDMFSVQLDAQGEFYDSSEGTGPSQGTEPSTKAAVVGGHASLRDPGLGLLGVFGGGAIASEDGEGKTATGFIVGGEAQFYLDNLTLYAQAGYGDIQTDDTDNDNDEGFLDGWFVRGVGRYFFTDDLMLQAEVSYGEVDEYVDEEDKGEFWNWGAKAKYRLLDETPLYVTAAYQGGFYDSTTEGDTAESHAFLGGVSFLIGATTLKENDRYGATLDMPLLPSRAASFEEDLD